MTRTKRTLTAEQKKLDANLWIIALITMAVYCLYAVIGSRCMEFCKDSSISVWPRLFEAAAWEFGIAGFGITVVCIIRKLSFLSFGLKKENALKAVLGTVACFVPYIAYIVLSGQFEGYEPLSIMVTPDLHKAGILTTIIGTLIVAIVWGFFEGFNYAVIAEFVSRRYPVKSKFFDWGALVCTIMGILFHPIHFDTLGMIDFVTTFIALYGMLLVRKYTKNSWGCVFAFLFIWNAL
ncbi:MAG: hypothetical protein K6C38_05940 [Saccharofermentans sp.]|nr:hypothetical protein [Saccharofermentans sp.]